MGEIIAQNILSWLELLINRYFCIYLVVYITVCMIFLSSLTLYNIYSFVEIIFKNTEL